MNENVAIKTQGLIKSYGSFRALHGVDLEVKQGEVFGFLGPNGAGKTTTIRCLLDLIHRDGGEVKVLGIDPRENPVAVKARVGYLPGELNLEGNQTSEKLLRYFSDLRADHTDWRYVAELGKRLDLDLKRPIKNLSHGNKQKAGIIQAFMHRPELLILDEPTVGLDPLVQQEVLRLIGEAQDGGATVFFSSHIMSEVEAITQRVGIIRRGKIIEVAETSALVKRSLRRARVRFQREVEAPDLSALPGVEILSKDDSLSLTLQIEGEMDALVKTLAKYPVSEFETERPTLEEVFLAYYEGDR